MRSATRHERTKQVSQQQRHALIVDAKEPTRYRRTRMNPHDEKVRDALHDTLTRANVDTRNLAIEVLDGRLIVKGTVPSADQQEQMTVLLRHCADQGLSLECDVSVLKVAPTDSLDGRGRSPVTGTSADSAHESRHQLDRS